MTITAGRGTIIAQEVGMTFTAVAQVTAVNQTGREGQNFDATVLSGPVGREYLPTGYSEPGSWDIEGFIDHKDASHQALAGLIAAPALTNFKITYPDTSEIAASIATVSLEETAGMDDGIRFTSSMKLSGLPTITPGT